jgi:hypothetical protein
MSGERWSLGGYARQYPWPQCRYCGRAQDHDCPRVKCLLCGAAQCFGNGSGNGLCAICHHGYLPGWSRIGRTVCARSGCEAPAVAIARKRPLCAAHAATVKVNGKPLAEYVRERLELLESGRLKVSTITAWQLVV